MKLRIFLIFMMFTAALLLPTFIVTSHDFNVEISCDEFGDWNHLRGDFDVEVGDKIRLELCSNPTTGFQWGYETTIEDVLEEEGHDFEEPDSNALGTAGIEIWTFKAVEAGETEVRMEYSQPWEGGLKSEWTYTMTVMVE
jgi:inhibitor of cysteine peptidase